MDDYYICFPVDWKYGTQPSDGFGGPPVENAGTLYAVADWTEEILCKTTLDELVAELLDGNVFDGVIDDELRECTTALRDALRRAADTLDGVLREKPP